jgi:hypothetical protein
LRIGDLTFDAEQLANERQRLGRGEAYLAPQLNREILD